MKKLILLTMVLGLLVAGEARADGAWVLWQDLVNTETYREYWYIESAFPSYESCRKELTDIVARGRIVAPQVRYVPVDGFATKDGYVVYKCLPESVDPRK